MFERIISAGIIAALACVGGALYAATIGNKGTDYNRVITHVISDSVVLCSGASCKEYSCDFVVTPANTAQEKTISRRLDYEGRHMCELNDE